MTPDALADGASTHELLHRCHGPCAALDGRHRGEDRTGSPAAAVAAPQLRPALRSLERDHSMIADLLGGFRGELGRHLEGAAAPVANHVRYEERELLTVPEVLDLGAGPRQRARPDPTQHRRLRHHGGPDLGVDLVLHRGRTPDRSASLLLRTSSPLPHTSTPR